MARLEMPDETAMTPEQRAACTEAASGPRGRVPAPMIAWLRSPVLARRSASLGEFLRFGTTLGPLLSELAILLCARHWTSHHEWTAHKRLALQAGLDSETIAAIAARRTPALRDDRERAVYDVGTVLLATGQVPPAGYDQGMAALGEQGMVELVGILGYYCLVSLTLNAFELGLPGSFASDLAAPGG